MTQILLVDADAAFAGVVADRLQREFQAEALVVSCVASAEAALVAMTTVICLRKNMHELIGEKGMDEYYWALLMESLLAVVRNYTDWTDQDEAERVKDWATLWCAMICTRLSLWSETWPPLEWESR